MSAETPLTTRQDRERARQQRARRSIVISTVSTVVVLVLGLVIALIRTSRAPALFPLRLLATVWVDVLRGVPTILVVYLVGFGIPALAIQGLPTSVVVLGGAALAMSYSAYVAEVFRAGIESIHPSQTAAALALGLTRRQAMRQVVLPQAVRASSRLVNRSHLAPEGCRARVDPRSRRLFGWRRCSRCPSSTTRR